MNNREPAIKDINKAVWSAIGRTVRKFSAFPSFFFTESDISAYFYHCIYRSGWTVSKGDSSRIYLFHREYPTNFLYTKKGLLDPSYQPVVYEKGKSKGIARGHYDFVALNPDYLNLIDVDIKGIVNKSAGTQRCNDEKVKPVLFAIEFKYIINNQSSFIDQIFQDNRKLEFSKDFGVHHGVNLIFSNIGLNKLEGVRKAIESTNGSINVIFVQSYYDGSRLNQPKPLVNLAKGDAIDFWENCLKERNIELLKCSYK